MVRFSRRTGLQLMLLSAYSGSIAGAFAQTWPTLVSLWTFDETGGAVFADSGPAEVPMDIVGTWADLMTDSMIQGIGGTSAYTDGSGHATIAADHPVHDLSTLTISFYYQRNSAAAKHVLLAAGDGTQAGDFSIEVLANGRLRGYHVGQDAQLRFFESTDGISGTDLQVGTAHRIDLTLGSLGARIYLDGAPLINAFILANTNGWNNTRIKYLGIFPQVELGGQADGAFDGLRIWDRQLSSAQVATLEPAQSITLPQAGTVDVGVLAAFTRSTIDVTALQGWPAGKLPKRILQQGARTSAYIRRSWKPSLNTGTHVDFVPGWQKTTGQESIRLQLDDDSEIDLTYTVGHAIPSPTAGGVTRTLDRSGGGDFTTWASAIAALGSGDVLVVRAPTGTWTDNGGHAIPNYVYDVSSNPAPPSGVSNVRVIAHPDDIAAGRRPIIWRNAGRYARFKYDPANAWQVHADLGGGHVVYQSVATSTQPGHSYFGAYRDQAGDWIGLYTYQAMTDGTDRSGVMHDTSYTPANGTSVTVFRGPGIIYNKTTNRWEVRLNAPVKQTYMNPASAAPYPPWDWTKHYAPSNDARNVEIVVTDGNGWGSQNHLLNLNGRNGWRFDNIDFIYGDIGIDARNCSTPPIFFGCSFLGGSPTDFDNDAQNISNTSSAVLTFGTTATPSADLLFDRCTIHGAMAPWSSFGEGKGFDGAHGHAMRRELTSWNRARVVFRYCSLRNWWHLTWMGDGNDPIKFHFHHCYMRQFGQDGALIQPSNGDYNVNRCFLPSANIYGFTVYAGTAFTRYFSFNVDLRLTTIMCGQPGSTKWAEIEGGSPGNGVNEPCMVHPHSTGHGGGFMGTDRKYYNTHVGSQHTTTIEFVDSTEGAGSALGPDTRGSNCRVFNSIGAVYPGVFDWPNGFSALVMFYTRKNGNNQYDHNVLFKSAGMLVPSKGSNTFAKVNSGSGGGTAYADLSALQSGEGFDLNSVQADPQFVVTPAWASTDPFAANGVYNLGNYLLGASSPARTGGRNLNDQSFPDYDFETPYTWAGGANAPWRGALQPDVPAIEQEVGIVGPQPPEIS